MHWVSYVLQALGGIGLLSGLAMLIAKYLVDRRLDQDRIQYQTQMDALLQDLRTRGEKEVFVHRLQFEKEFEIYMDLWKDALTLGCASTEFRELKVSSGKSEEQQRQEFVEAYGRFNHRVYDYRPFYAPPVYDLAKDILKKCSRVFMLQGMSNPLERGLRDQVERLLDEVNAAIDPLCDAIRRQIWSKDAGAEKASG